MLSLKTYLLIFAMLNSLTTDAFATDDDAVNEEEEEEEQEEITLEKAKETLEQISPQIEANLKWEFELKCRDLDKLSFVESASITLDEASIKDRLQSLKEELGVYRDIVVTDMELKRQFDLLREFHCGARGEKHVEALKNITEDFYSMEEDVYFCSYQNKSDCSINYDAFGLKEKQSSDSPEEILYYFNEIKTKIGEYIRRKFPKYVNEYQLLAACNNMTPTSMFLYEFEDDTIMDQLDIIMKDLEPLYLQIHAYIRHILSQKYGEAVIPHNEAIRDDIFVKFMSKRGYMHYTPYPEKRFPDIESEMKNQNYTGLKIMKLADELFISMNMTKAPKYFWTNFVHEYSGHSGCNPAALGVLVKDNIGFHYCNELSFRNFMLTFAEMAKVQYNLNMNKLPVAYRLGMWPGFIEGISKAIQTAISKFEYVKKIGLMSNSEIDLDVDVKAKFLGLVNSLFSMRCEYAKEKLRLDILEGKVELDDYNVKYWELREEYCGIKSPIKRSVYDFDAALQIRKFNNRSIRNILENILGYQISEGLCKINRKSNDTKIFENCDFFGNIAVGEKLSEAMSLGASKHWKEILNILTGESKLKASSMINLFEPARKWLEDYNSRNNVTIGWIH